MNLHSNGGMREVKNCYVSVQKKWVYELTKQWDCTAACIVNVSSHKQKGFLYECSQVATGVSVCFADICRWNNAAKAGLPI